MENVFGMMTRETGHLLIAHLSGEIVLSAVRDALPLNMGGTTKDRK